jgi:hypothetical protein
MILNTTGQDASKINCFGANETPSAKLDILSELELTEDDWNLNETDLSTFKFEL